MESERGLKKRVGGRKICIYGTGVYGIALAIYFDRNEGYEIASFCDSDQKKWGKLIYKDICCSSPDKINRNDIVCIAVDREEHEKEIFEKCQKLSFETITGLRPFITQYMPEIDDEVFIKAVWFSKMGYLLDLNHPSTYNEKLQWLKLYDRNPEYAKLVNKYEVKQFVSNAIGGQYVIPTLGVYNSFDEIDFSSLPEQFVLKCTHDSGSIVICKNKAHFDVEYARNKLVGCLEKNFYLNGREWAYKNAERKIIAEQYMVDESGEGLKDYKIFNFNGKAKIIQVDYDRFINHRRNLYTTDWELIQATIEYPMDPDVEIQRPRQLKKMLEFAEALSKDIPHVRTDFYSIADKIYFGEMTFYPESGFGTFTPPEFGQKAGEWLKLFTIESAGKVGKPS